VLENRNPNPSIRKTPHFTNSPCPILATPTLRLEANVPFHLDDPTCCSEADRISTRTVRRPCFVGTIPRQFSQPHGGVSSRKLGGDHVRLLQCDRIFFRMHHIALVQFDGRLRCKSDGTFAFPYRFAGHSYRIKGFLDLHRLEKTLRFALGSGSSTRLYVSWGPFRRTARLWRNRSPNEIALLIPL